MRRPTFPPSRSRIFERVEVYLGYIPARFGGTYIGGVINIVTKRPGNVNVSAQFGQRTWGGYTDSLQVDTPLGEGSLMIGINRDQSDGDFKYTNYSSYAYETIMPRYRQELETAIPLANSQLKFNGISIVDDNHAYVFLGNYDST